MKLITFVQQGQPRLGALAAHDGHERVYDLNRLEPRLPDDILAFLEAGQAALALAAAGAGGRDAGSGPGPWPQSRLKAPIPRPGKIICIGQNYLAHAQESNASAPPFPIIFAKYANTVIGHGEPIVVPAAVQKPDYEGELAVVIGTPGTQHPGSRARSTTWPATCRSTTSAPATGRTAPASG